MSFFDELLKDKKDLPFNLSSETIPAFVKYKNCLFEIKVNSPEIDESLRSLYNLMIENNDHQTHFLKKIQYCHFNEFGKYIITRNDKFAYSFDNFIDAVPWFDWMLMSDIVDHHKELTLIHASALVKDGKTIILVGDSGCGKSTLAIMMCLNGWTFITDDVVLVDKGIQGIPRAFCLAENLANDLFGKSASFVKGIKRKKGYVYINPDQINIKTNQIEVPVTHIVFPKKSQKKNGIKYLSPSITMCRLIENLFDVSISFQAKLDILINNVEKATAVALFWSNANLAIKEIEKFIN